MGLPAAPPAVPDGDGQPIAGQFQGRCKAVDWRRLAGAHARSAFWRRFHHKRWQYVGIAAEDCFVACAIVDIGWTNTAFAYVFDRRSGQVVGGLSRDGVPGLTAQVVDVPTAGEAGRFAWLGDKVSLRESAANCFEVAISGRDGLQVRANLDGRAAAPWLFACGPVPGGVWHSTHKSSALLVSGEAQAGGKTFTLDGAYAALDYSNGLLPRETRWRWASAHTPAIGFNLQAGYFGDQENALWLDGELIALAAAHFEFDAAEPMRPWRVWTDDGLLDLTFTPEGARREDRNLLVAASRYIQPVGTFSGSVRAGHSSAARPVSNMLGVVEDHASRW